jgi:hypothetical protein
MKTKIISVVALASALVACGPGPASKAPESAPQVAAAPLPAGPEYDSTGVIAAVDGQTLTLDHDGASGAKLVPGRTVFRAYADVLAEAPLTPGSRVAFKFREIGGEHALTALAAR